VNRRTMLYGGVAAAAAVAGIGAAWWSTAPQTPGVAGKPGAGGDPNAAFWNLSFDTPDGQALAMSSFRGKPLLVNFWATWCPPCIEELPLLNSFHEANKASFQVLGLAIDQPSAVRKWLQARPMGFATGMAGLEGTHLSKTLGNSSGSLPFTAVFDRSGELVHRKTGKVLPEELAAWLKKA
jgi:thiol-disulfide isomerase/thioredoxin